LKKNSVIRTIAIPLLCIILVVGVFLIPSGTDFASLDDIRSIQVSGADGTWRDITEKDDIQAFYDWLITFVPEDEIHFVRKNSGMLSPASLISATVVHVPENAYGADAADSYAYSKYNMYIYAEDGVLYYNGVPYEITPDGLEKFSQFASWND
jgi:hypothetical protein